MAILANRYGTDKLWLHHYIDEYERHFERLRGEPIKLLEIGVGGYNVPGRGGHSLRMWSDYFVNGEITGIDIEDKTALSSGNITALVMDQTDVASLELLSGAAGPFDIVVDDGSHVQEHIMISFCTLFPLMPSGGIYVIEDLACAYNPFYAGGPDLPVPNSIGLIQRLIDGLHWEFWGGRHTGPTPIDRMVKSVHVSKELAFIYRK